MSIRFSRIEQDVLAEHARLTSADECYYLYEYTSGRDYSFGPANSLINNLKKDPSACRARGVIAGHKAGAIRRCASEMGSNIDPTWLRSATLVPVPPSKAQGHAEYDDRMAQVLRQFGGVTGIAVDVRELVIQNASMAKAHEGVRPSMADLLAAYQIDETIVAPAPRAIGIFDDVLTAGTHFKAVQQKLTERFPGVRTVGFFVARRVFPPGAVADDFVAF